MPTERRPVLFITYSQKDTDSSVLDVSGSLREARWEAFEANRGGFVYRVERLKDGEYGNEQFVEELP